MNTRYRFRIAPVGVAAALVMNLQAATTWTGAINTALTNAGNWDNGVPNSASNPGTIPAGAGSITHSFTLSGYHVIQNGGTFTAGVASTLQNGSWTLNTGGTFSPGVPFTLQSADNGNQDFTMTGGTINSGSTMVVSTSGTNRTASFAISGGSATFSGAVTLNDGGNFTISGGMFTTTNNFQLSGSASTLTVNGGAINAANLGRSGDIFLNGGTINISGALETFSGFSMNLGGSAAGSITANTLAGGFQVGSRNFNWLPGSQMSFTVVTGADWAEIEWNAGRMFYNGDGEDVLGDWATVNGTIFAWDGGTNTLSLVPEPSSSVLLGLVGGLVLLRRRRQ